MRRQSLKRVLIDVIIIIMHRCRKWGGGSPPLFLNSIAIQIIVEWLHQIVATHSDLAIKPDQIKEAAGRWVDTVGRVENDNDSHMLNVLP